jgi:hypothetical protein
MKSKYYMVIITDASRNKLKGWIKIVTTLFSSVSSRSVSFPRRRESSQKKRTGYLIAQFSNKIPLDFGKTGFWYDDNRKRLS